MADAKSPAPKWLRNVVAVAFVIVWLAVTLIDFFVSPGESNVPFWFQGTGLLVLGYLLGVTLDDIPRGK